MPYIAVHGDGGEFTEAVAAVCIHGFFPSQDAADAAAAHLANDGSQPDVHAYIVDRCGRWLPVRTPDAPEAAEETAEIKAPENDDPKRGKMGSVCDILRGGKRTAEQSSSSSDTRDLRQTLDDLLNAPAPTVITSSCEYAHVRGRYAALRAFQRRLEGLLAEQERKVCSASREIAELDALQPSHQRHYQQQFETALKESGVRRESVGFMRYLELPDDTCA